MKYKIVLFILLFPVFANAQKVSTTDSVLVNNLLADLRDSWTLGVDSSNAVDIRLYNKFKSLFDTSNATIDDDFNYQYQLKKQPRSYSINPITRDFDVYAYNIALQVSKLIIDSGKILHKDLRNPDSITVLIQRNIYAEKPRKFLLQDIDAFADSIVSNHPGMEFERMSKREKEATYKEMLTNLKTRISNNPDSVYQFAAVSTILVTMVQVNATDVLIKSIKNISNNLICVNDKDGDAVLNREDSMPGTFGDFTANGMPDDDLDGVADSRDKCPVTYGVEKNQGCPISYFITRNQAEGFLGSQLNLAKINLPELNKLGYKDDAGNDATDVLQSKKGVLKNPGLSTGVYAGGNYVRYFGNKRKRAGVSIGFNYSRFTANYSLTEPAVYTFKAFDGDDYYRRQVTITGLQEEIVYNVINVPVLFSYRFRPTNKLDWVINMKAGPSFMLFNNKSNYDALIDIGGIYQVDSINNEITYNNFLAEGSTYNVYVTSNGINHQNTNPGAINVFSQLSKNYDFVSNRNYHGKKNLDRATVAFNFSFDSQHKILRDTEKDYELAMKIGFHFLYAPLFDTKDRYIPIERSTDDFNSLYNSYSKSAYLAFGLNVGFVFNF